MPGSPTPRTCSAPLEEEPSPYAELGIVRHQALADTHQATDQTDLVAEEYPVAIVFNGISHAVMMASPGHLKEFAVGFALSEGIVSSRSEIYDVEVDCYEEAAQVQVTISQAAFTRLKNYRRTLTGRTGCGVCGTESLQLLDLAALPIGHPSALNVAPEGIQRILEVLPQYQPLTRATGCAHAAAWCSPKGEIRAVFEDVGRHNALDKLFGWMALHNEDPTQGFVFLTSRASYELIRKSARMNVGTIATISAPTTLAIRIAHDSGIRLLSFCRKNGCVEYPLSVKK